MKRRTLLLVGAGAGTVLALAGGTLALLKPGLQQGRLSTAGREIFAAVARGVLADLLPAAPGHLQRLDDTIAGLPPPLQAEISELVTLLASTPGRLALAGLRPDWPQASEAELQAMLQGLRVSSLHLRQQLYHALRNLTNGAYFADASTWPAIGYPGPRPV